MEVIESVAAWLLRLKGSVSCPHHYHLLVNKGLCLGSCENEPVICLM